MLINISKFLGPKNREIKLLKLKVRGLNSNYTKSISIWSRF